MSTHAETIITSAEVAKVLEGEAARLAYILEGLRGSFEKYGIVGLRSAFDHRQGGIMSGLCDAWCALRDLNERLYPEGENSKYWGGYDMSCELYTPMGLLDLLQDGNLSEKSFPENCTDRALQGMLKLLESTIDHLLETAGRVMAEDVIEAA